MAGHCTECALFGRCGEAAASNRHPAEYALRIPASRERRPLGFTASQDYERMKTTAFGRRFFVLTRVEYGDRFASGWVADLDRNST